MRHNLRTSLPAALLSALLPAFAPPEARAFCGCMFQPIKQVEVAGAKPLNKYSEVAIVRDGNRTVISMMNDYRGPVADFALVVPIPTVLQRGQIHVGEKELFEKLAAFTAVRLVEQDDFDPCWDRGFSIAAEAGSAQRAAKGAPGMETQRLDVVVEAKYTVGEYDIVILSSEQSADLEAWLRLNGYRIPAGASEALMPYIRAKQKFFVAKVNLKELAKTGLSYLRPLQFAFETEKFMLPIRLGMLNADGPQELLVYALTRGGRVEATNYRTVRIPSGGVLPAYVKGEFDAFYAALFDREVKKENMRAVFTEFSGQAGFGGNSLSRDELKRLGVFWLDGSAPSERTRRMTIGQSPLGSAPVAVTRLHVRYTPETFPQDLMFQETQDRGSFQSVFTVRKPWRGDPNQCDGAQRYHDAQPAVVEGEAQTLARLTGWDINSIRGRIEKLGGPKPAPQQEWWEGIWK